MILCTGELFILTALFFFYTGTPGHNVKTTLIKTSVKVKVKVKGEARAKAGNQLVYIYVRFSRNVDISHPHSYIW